MSSSPSLNVSLTPQLQSFIAGLVASGRYQTASEAVGQHSGCWKSPVGIMIVANDGGPEIMINAYGSRLLGAEERHRGLKPAVMPIRLFENGEELPRERQPIERAVRTGETVSTWQGCLRTSRVMT
jgi:hypothetical protein